MKHKVSKAKERINQTNLGITKLTDDVSFTVIFIPNQKNQNSLISSELVQFRHNMSSYRESLNKQIEEHAKNEMKMYEELKYILDNICVRSFFTIELKSNSYIN